MSYRLFLDDERNPYKVHQFAPPGPWTIARSYREFVEIIERDGIPKHVSFDRDLHEDHYNPETWHDENFPHKVPTGEAALLWLLNYCAVRGVSFPNYSVHTMNPVAGPRMVHLILSRTGKRPSGPE